MEFGVPVVPDGGSDEYWWRWLVCRVGRRSEFGLSGFRLAAGDVIDVPRRSVVVTLDPCARAHVRTGSQSLSTTSIVSVYVVGETIRRHMPRRDRCLYEIFAFDGFHGMFWRRALETVSDLLRRYPPTRVAPTVITQARRPAWRQAECHWCAQVISVGGGHMVGFGDQARAEHWQTCPRGRVDDGELCVDCYREVRGVSAYRGFDRDRLMWSVHHDENLACVDNPQPTPAEYAAITAAQDALMRARVEQQRERQMRVQLREERKSRERRGRAAQREKERLQAIADEQVRIAGMALYYRESTVVTSKSIAPGGARAYLYRHDDQLEGGLTTVRWSVRAPDISEHAEEFTLDEQEARDLYRSYRYDG